jgi:hypothetical protein
MPDCSELLEFRLNQAARAASTEYDTLASSVSLVQVERDLGGSAQPLRLVERVFFVIMNLEGSLTKGHMGCLPRSMIVFLALLRPNLW